MSKIDSLLKKSGLFERLALYGDRKSFLESMAQDVGPSLEGGHSGDLATDPNMTPNPNAALYNAKVDGNGLTPAENAKLNPTAKVSIPTSVQQKLNDLLVPAGKILPIKVDGVLGDETKRALNAFRKAYNIPPTLTEQQLFSKVMSAGKLNSEALPPDHPLFKQLEQEGPSPTSRFSSTIDKANLFHKLSQKYEK